MKTIIDHLNWRYAVKKYSDRKVEPEKLDAILEAIRLSASSAGMQPYRVALLSGEELRRELGADSFNAQIGEASHLLVFAAKTNISKEDISTYMDLVAAVREIPVESLQPFQQSLESHLLTRTDADNFNWASRQAYIALGTAIVAAAEFGVDATPMEGFNGAKFDEKLGLNELGYKSVVLLSLGYRNEEQDIFAHAKKVRLPKEELIWEKG